MTFIPTAARGCAAFQSRFIVPSAEAITDANTRATRTRNGRKGRVSSSFFSDILSSTFSDRAGRLLDKFGPFTVEQEQKHRAEVQEFYDQKRARVSLISSLESSKRLA